MEKTKYYVKYKYQTLKPNRKNRYWYVHDKNVLIKADTPQDAWVHGIDYFFNEIQKNEAMVLVSLCVVGYYNRIEDFVYVNLTN